MRFWTLKAHIGLLGHAGVLDIQRAISPVAREGDESSKHMHIPMRTLLATALFCSVAGTTIAHAQSTTAPVTGSISRNPVLGDPGPRDVRTRAKPTASRAQDISRGDKQPAGTMNGNQPDRASAGGGGR